MKKAHCDIYKRVIAECEHYLAKGNTVECKKAIQQLRAYEESLSRRTVTDQPSFVYKGKGKGLASNKNASK